MASATKNTAHMSPEAENRFEDKLQGDGAGNVDDWEAELGLKVLDIRHKIAVAKKDGDAKTKPIVAMLENKLEVYQAAIECIQANPKLALDCAGKEGMRGLIAYFVRQAKEEATKAETAQYIGRVQKTLPGFKLQEAVRLTGKDVGGQAAASSSSISLAY